MNSKSIQSQFNLPSNSYKNAFNLSPSSPYVSFNFRNTDFKNPTLISIRKTPNQPTKAAASNGVYTEETLYDLLGVSQSGTASEIKRAYKHMALKYHPDVSQPDHVHEYTARFIRVQEAYETLSDPESRAVYDCNLAKAFSVKRGSRFAVGSDEMARWKQSWQVQVEELKRRSMEETVRAGQDGRMSWAARIRKQRAESDLDESGSF